MPHLHLSTLLSSSQRRVAGLMSGTSLDGVDAIIAVLDGTGPAMQITVESFISQPYPSSLKQALLANSRPGSSSVDALSQLNVRLSHVYKEALEATLKPINRTFSDLDLIGSHGQTVYHVPNPTACAGQAITSTLQIGDPSTLANLTSTPVVGDFRLADMALGGQGAPLVPYFDYVYFSDATETRGLLNLGGIANMTVLPKETGIDAVYAFDTGPSNMVMDALSQRFFDRSCDENGAYARQGTIHQGLLHMLLSEPYLKRMPPKSTGREAYGAAFVQDLIAYGDQAGLLPEDLLATATAFTAASIHQAYTDFIAPNHPLDVLIASGGGIHNGYLMELLRQYFTPIPVQTTASYNVDADAKEALCFAILAHEYLNGVPTNVPKVTGATHPTLLGKLCLPSPLSAFHE